MTKTLTLINRLGLHLRAAAEFAKTAAQFKCMILVKNNHGVANGKSLINLIALSAGSGSELKVTLQGEDAKDAWDAVYKICANKFGEKE